MSKRRDIRLHETTLDHLDVIKGMIATLIDYHEQANNQRVAEIKLNTKSAGFNWHEVARAKDTQLTEAHRQIETLAKGNDAWQREANAQRKRAEELAASLDLCLGQRGRLEHDNKQLEADRDLWQARCNNACQKLSELDTDNRYNGIQVDCPEAREHLDRILKKFLNAKKTAIHAHG